MRLFFLAAWALAAGPGDDARVEDFEGPVLDGWERVASDVHPPYNTVGLVRDPDSAKSGSQFLRMRTMGGSTAIRRPARFAWPVDPSRPYRLTVFARLTEARRNAAVATLTWLDREGAPLGELRSVPMTRGSGWRVITLEATRIPAGTASASPRLEFEGDDVRGECDFDRLVLAPVELLEVRPAGRTRAVYFPGDFPRFTLAFAGAPAGTYGITCVMKSASGAEIRRTALLTTPSEQPATVDFPPPAPGAYELSASVDGREARRSLVVLVPNPRLSPDPLRPDDPSDLAAIAGTARGATPNPPGDSLASALRRRIAHPEIPLALDDLFIDGDGDPRPGLLALRATNDVLADAVPLPDPGIFSAPIRTAAFRRGSTIALALWCDEGEVQVSPLMNAGARLYPAFGALHPLRTGEKIVVGPVPTFLVDIDPLVIDLKLSLSGDELPLQLNPSTRALRLHNPTRTRGLRDVRVRLEAVPEGWQISPREMTAAMVAPDGDLVEDLKFVVPTTESERTLDLRFEIRFVQGGQEQVVHLSRGVRLVSAVGITSSVAAGLQPYSRKVTVRVTNRSDRVMTLAVRARLPHLPERTDLVRELAPGSASGPFEYVVNDVHLIDPTHLAAEIDVQESVGARASARALVPLR